VDGEEEYEVQRIDDFRLFRRQLQNLVKCRGYDEHSWECVTNVDGFKAIDDFYTEQPGKPGS
jgi:hypothetical protein